ncbi:hydroxyacylglutathione hydrolase [Betaproteobacteria bacterium]|nr:hydroxyacylglutathione hydrolase [Betaproteobacteria bacterium]
MIRRFNAFSDNYIWGIEIHKTICIVDPGQSYEVLKHLENFEHFFSIGAILVTHRHHDHIGGIKELAKSRFAGSEIKISLNESPIFNQMPIFGPTDCQRYGVKHIVSDGDIINIGDNTIEVLDIPGHTEQHVGYLFRSAHDQPPAFFCGDTLFGGGCGRVLGGSFIDLYASLKKISKLPKETLIYCAHEYTEANLKFAREFFPDNSGIKKRYAEVKKDREKLLPTIPTELSYELETNPYLTCKNFNEFKAIRMSKDNWKG